MPNMPFHLRPASLPAVARSAAGERRRSAGNEEGARLVARLGGGLQSVWTWRSVCVTDSDRRPARGGGSSREGTVLTRCLGDTALRVDLPFPNVRTTSPDSATVFEEVCACQRISSSTTR